MNEPQDTILIKRVLSGDIQKYGLLVDKYQGRIRNLAYMMIGNQHDAEDLAQEAFVRAYRALPKFERKAKFSSWLYQITLNLCKDYLKAKSRSARSTEEEHLEAIDAGPRDLAVDDVLDMEMSQKMREAVSKLPKLYREAFILREIQAEDYEVIAEATGVSADTVRVRAYRAREMLRELLAKDVDTFWREKAAKEKAPRN